MRECGGIVTVSLRVFMCVCVFEHFRMNKCLFILFVLYARACLIRAGKLSLSTDRSFLSVAVFYAYAKCGESGSSAKCWGAGSSDYGRLRSTRSNSTTLAYSSSVGSGHPFSRK